MRFMMMSDEGGEMNSVEDSGLVWFAGAWRRLSRSEHIKLESHLVFDV